MYHLRRSLNPEPVEARVSTESIIINGLSSGKDYTIFVQSHYATMTKEYPSELSTTQTHCSIPLLGKLKCCMANCSNAFYSRDKSGYSLSSEQYSQ